MTCRYMGDKNFKKWFRSCVALPFLPPQEIEQAISSLRQTTFEDETCQNFLDYFMDYLESTWLNGQFILEVWNFWRKPSGLTNNNNEGYNSRINKGRVAKYEFFPNLGGYLVSIFFP